LNYDKKLANQSKEHQCYDGGKYGRPNGQQNQRTTFSADHLQQPGIVKQLVVSVEKSACNRIGLSLTHI
jgi:hypothetical protein